MTDWLTTQQAADRLGVSRPFLVARIDAGDLPSRRVGNRRQVTAEAVSSYAASLLTRESQANDEYGAAEGDAEPST